MNNRPPLDAAFQLGEVLCQRFRVTAFIAQGGMGEVYEAEDLELGISIALKTIRKETAEDPVNLSRFKREIKLARAVTHPNVCRIFDLFTHETEHDGAGQLFLTMELLPGETLKKRLQRDGAMSTDDALDIVRQMVAGLSSAHRAGVVHRDLKSDNVYLVPEPEGGERVVITDFGLAQSPKSVPADDSAVTAAGRWVGTPAYISPEQLQGEPAGIASDIYALGVVLYEMVTGEKPFTGPDPMSAAVRRLVEDPTSPGELIKGLDQRWDAVILRCLRRDPERRFASADEILPVLTGEDTGVHISRRALAALAALVTILIVAGAAFFWTRHAARSGPSRPSVAVLGFRNLEAHTDTAWMGPALGEMMATELAAGENVVLVPGEDVARARMELALPEVESFSLETLDRLRALLDSDYVVLGSYLALDIDEGGEIRVDLRVQDTASGSLLASFSTSGVEDDLFRIVSLAGTEIRRKLGIDAPSATAAQRVRAALPADPEATRLYSEGLEHLRTLDFLAARNLLEDAVTAEPDFPLAHAALARALTELGHGQEAVAAVDRAFELADDLPRELRLAVEAQYRETTSDWSAAIAIYQSLWTVFPENLRYGMRLAEAELASGAATHAMETLSELHRRVQTSEQPELLILEARVASARSDYPGQRDLSRQAAAVARRLDARLLLAQARIIEGQALWRLGESTEAIAAFEEARSVFRTSGFAKGEADALRAIGLALMDEGHGEEAEANYRQALDITAEIGDASGTAAALLNLGNLYLMRDEIVTARRHFDEALAIHQQTGDLRKQARVLKRRAVLSRRQGDLEGARSAYTEAYEALRSCGDRNGAAAALNSIAVVLRQQGRLEEAAAALEKILEIKSEIGHRRSLAVPLVNLANVQLDMGDLAAAKQSYSEALDVARELESPRYQSYALFGLGEVAFARGELASAQRYHEQALTLRTEAGEGSAVVASQLAVALVLTEAGSPDEALRRIEDALTRLEGDSAQDMKAWAQAARARAATAAGDLPLARTSVKAATTALAGSDDRAALIFLDVAAARLEIAVGDPSAAIDRLSDALGEVEQTGLGSARIEVLISLGEAESLAGETKSARDHLEEALGLAERGGYGLHISKAGELLSRQQGPVS